MATIAVLIVSGDIWKTLVYNSKSTKQAERIAEREFPEFKAITSIDLTKTLADVLAGAVDGDDK